MTNLNFTLYDFFVDVIPGVTALLLIVPLLPDTLDLSWLLDMTVGIVLLIVGYIVGHFLQGLASWIDGTVRLKFVSRLGIERNNLTIKYPFEAELARRGKDDSIRSGFDDGKSSFFDPELSGAELFRTVQSYLWNNDIGRMRRFQTLYTLFRSIWVLFLISSVAYGIATVLTFIKVYDAVLNPIYLGAATFLLVVGAVGSYRRRVTYHREMAKAMIYDFYTHTKTNTDDR